MKLYFASDVHLGAPTIADHRKHELNFVHWLDKIKDDADEIYLLGDIFDYWFEYHTVVPKGFVRTLGRLAEMTDRGIKVHIFTGNHDVWMWNYLEKECGLIVHHDCCSVEADGRRLYIGHGDGVGGYDKGYALLKWLFTCRVAQVLYSWLHPDIAGWIATTWSGSSRKKDNKNVKFHSFRGEDEHQVRFARTLLDKGEPIDYFVFGHRHVVADYPLNEACRLVVLGEWMEKCTYAVLDDGEISVYNFLTGEKINNQ